MVQPIIVRWLKQEQLEKLDSDEKLAFFSWIRLEPGTSIMAWYEEKAKWVFAQVIELIEKPTLRQLENLVDYTPYGTLDKWLDEEAKKHEGSLPANLLLVSKFEPGV